MEEANKVSAYSHNPLITTTSFPYTTTAIPTFPPHSHAFLQHHHSCPPQVTNNAEKKCFSPKSEGSTIHIRQLSLI
ncbi:hypothetical protein E2C01_099524 [Portunus trituberculatus]|uniref:Uncharacterized protein n=1 Tax=Portunus trituberculatus TaxID=210409 RepID=A0A5B7KF75_PORTR|nr:hypothetical protein [Portunus trituberculatus]